MNGSSAANEMQRRIPGLEVSNNTESTDKIATFRRRAADYLNLLLHVAKS